jgi:ABC-type glycerol-3-phosphate transport system substrate-binding protein
MTRRELLRAGSAAFSGGLLLACGKRGTPEPPTPVPRDITVTVAMRANEQTQAALEKFMPAVRYGLAPGGRHGMPNIQEIPIVSTPERSFADGVRQRVAAGESPDVIWFGLQDDLPEILRGDLLRPLAPFLDNDPDNTLKGYHPASLRALQFWGQQIALPAALGILSVRYDTEILTAREVPPPQPNWTWDDFAAMAASLTHTADGNTIWGFSSSVVPAWLLFIIGAGGRVADLGEGETALDSSEARRGLEFWLSLAYKFQAMETGPQLTVSTIMQRRKSPPDTPLRLELINWHNTEPYSLPFEFVGTPTGPTQSVPMLITDMVGVSGQSADLDAAYAVAKPLAAQMGSSMLVPPRNNAIEFIRRPDRMHADLALGLDRADVVLRSLSFSVGTTFTLYSGLGKSLTEQMALPALRGDLDSVAALEAGAAIVREWMGSPPG